jgi:nucleoside-diphosphate-sugar epimerase
MRILLTGATGFIGKRVLDFLLDDGDSVTALVVPETLRQLRNRAQVRVVLGDLSDSKTLRKATEDSEIVVHLAGKIVGSSPAELAEVNVQGTGHLLRACHASGVRRLIFVSSAAVYKPVYSAAQLPIKETNPLGPSGGTPLGRYGRSKLDAERLVLQCHDTHGLEYCILRPTVVYGPGSENASRSTEKVLCKLLGNAGRVLLAPQRLVHMQWVHIGDITDAILSAIRNPVAANEIFTIAGPEAFNFAIMTLIMLDILRPASKIRFSGRCRDPIWSPSLMYDITKAGKTLGYKPKIGLKTGLAQVLEDMDRKGRLPSLFSRRAHLGLPA